MTSVILRLILITIMVGVYLLPSIVAWRRRHLNTAAIFILNLMLGWTVLGWIVCLVWSFTNRDRRAPA